MQAIINPLEFLNYQAKIELLDSEISQSDKDSLKAMVDNTRSYLSQHHADDYVLSLLDVNARSKIRHYIADYIKEARDVTFNTDMKTIIQYVQREITEMGVLQPALDDPSISSIEINGPGEVVVEQDGFPVHRIDIRFDNVDHIYQIIDRMLMPIGKTLNASTPIIDSNYRGFRINAIADVTRGGVSLDSPIISIRKFPPDVYLDEACIQYGNISEEISNFNRDVIPAGANILIGGGTNSGKTATLMRTPLYLDPLERILTIEDSAEMMLKQKTSYENYPNIAAMVAKEHVKESSAQPIWKLVKTSLRQNPDWIFIGEIRDEETAKQALVAANTGHFIASSIHANSAREAAIRLLQLNGNTITAASQIGTTIDLIYFQEYHFGKRIVTEIAELIGFQGTEEPILNPIFTYDFSAGHHVLVGKLKKLKKNLTKARVSEEILRRWCE